MFKIPQLRYNSGQIELPDVQIFIREEAIMPRILRRNFIGVIEIANNIPIEQENRPHPTIDERPMKKRRIK